MVKIVVTLLRSYILDMENAGSRSSKEIWFSPSPHVCSTRIGDENIWFSAICEDLYKFGCT